MLLESAIFISYCVWNFHSNWLGLLFLRVMQENKSGCFFLNTSRAYTINRWLIDYYDIQFKCWSGKHDFLNTTHLFKPLLLSFEAFLYSLFIHSRCQSIETQLVGHCDRHKQSHCDRLGLHVDMLLHHIRRLATVCPQLPTDLISNCTTAIVSLT